MSRASASTTVPAATAAHPQTSAELAEILRKEMRSTKGPLSAIWEADAIATRVSPAVLQFLGAMEQAVVMARAIKDMQVMVSDAVLNELLPLMDSSLGFVTDRRGKEPYPREVVRDCLVEALIYGALPTGNEFNIISGRCYLAKAYFLRKLSIHPGLTDLRRSYGVPKVATGGAVVPCKATWRLNGVEDSIEADIPVKLNTGMGSDGALGKAERKLNARIYGRITGSNFTPEGEVDEPSLATRGEPSSDNAAALAGMKAAAETAKTEPEPPPTPRRNTSTGDENAQPPADAPKFDLN